MLVDFTNYRPGLRRERLGLYEVGPGLHASSLMSAEEWLHSIKDYPEGEAWFQDSHFFPISGSCDSISQFTSHGYFRNIIESPHSFLVLFEHVDKIEGGCYNFHKQGEYLGTLRQGKEYLADEPNMHSLYHFSVFRRNF